MSWSRVGDEFYDAPPTLTTSLEALGLHLLALSYCARHLTDGRVSDAVVTLLARGVDNAVRLSRELSAAKLWHPGEGGWFLAGYLQSHRAAKYVIAERKAAKLRMRKFRVRSVNVRTNKRRSSENVPDGKKLPILSILASLPPESPTNTKTYTDMDVREVEEKTLESLRNFRTLALELLELVNSKGFRYQPGKANLDFLRARLREYDDFTLAAMVNRQWARWKDDDKMRLFFRPATLFNREKCAQYVGQLTAQDRAWITARRTASSPPAEPTTA